MKSAVGDAGGLAEGVEAKEKAGDEQNKRAEEALARLAEAEQKSSEQQK